MIRLGPATIWIGASAAALACACAGPRERPADRSAASASATATPASASPSATPPAALAAPCATPFVVEPRHPDSFVDQAAASPAYDMGAWSPRPMSGPFATRDLARAGCADVTRLAATAPFDEIVACRTGDPMKAPGPENIASHVLVLRTARGFWAHEIVRDHWPHGRGEARVARVEPIVAADRLGDRGVEITAIAEEGPPGGAKSRHVLVCGLGPSGVPACLDVRVAAGGPFHGAGALEYRLTLACDGALSIAGWEGGAPVKLVHGRGPLAFP